MTKEERKEYHKTYKRDKAKQKEYKKQYYILNKQTILDAASRWTSGEWEIDHPVSSFAPDTHPAIVNSLNNLQPLWWLENIAKGDRYTIKNRTE